MDICLRVGIGDLLVCKAMLMKQAESEKINITLEETHLPLRGGEPYRTFIWTFAHLLFYEPNFVIKGFERSKHTGYDDLYRNGVRPVLLPIQTQLCSKTTLEGKYVCLNTKVRGYSHDNFCRQQDILMPALQNLSENFTLVLLGEREVEYNNEYLILTKNSVYSIYPNVKNLPKTIDLTVPVLGLTSPSINKFKEDCAIMNGAIITLNVGYGGNLYISSSLGNTINIEETKIAFNYQMFGDRCIEYFDATSFVNALEKIKSL